MSEAGGHSYLRTHSISGEALLLDIDEEAKAVTAMARSAAVGHAAKTLVKDGPLRSVILGFKAGSALRDHHVDGPVSIHVLSGSVDVASPRRSDALRAGDVLFLDSEVKHSVSASSDAVLLVTIARPGPD